MLLHHGAVREPERLTARVLDKPARSAGCRLETYRDGDTFHIDIDLPGVDPADIDFSVDDRVLTVRAARRHDGLRLVTGEKQLPLSDTLDTDRIDARYEDGQLTLQIPIMSPADLAEAA
jgi:HSP20 family protein